ncbi:LysR family transcriptional regulator [Microbacterium sp. NPDC091313]
METRLLEYVVAVADEGSVTAASARVFAAQSTVSAGLKSLERELGVQLFERTTTSVRLTAAGEALLPLARTLLDDLAAVRAIAAESGTGLRGRIRMGTFAGLRIVDLPGLLGDFRRTHPRVDIRVSVSSSGSVGLTDDLERDRLDLALTALPPAPGLQAWQLGSYPYVALLPPSHPLADGVGAIGLADLAGDDWVDVPPGYGNRVQLEAELARRTITRRIAAELGELPDVPRYVAAGLGVAVVPDILETDGCVVRALSDDVPPWVVSLTAGRSALRRPHVRALLDHVLAAR